MGAVTVITSGKGGVGKSTTTAALGRALAALGRRVLLVDLDAGLRTLDRITGIENRLVYDISDVVKGRCAPRDSIYKAEGSESLFVMPAPARGEDMVSMLVMKKLTAVLKRYYDHVLLDSPAGIGSGFKAAACAADRVIIVCNPDPVCVRGTATVKTLLSEMGISKQRLIINRYNSELFEKIRVMQDLDRVIDEAGVRLIGVVPEDSAFSAAVLRGEEAQGSLSGTMAFSRIAARLEGRQIPVLL